MIEASETPILRRHVVVVLVDRLDAATARALQYARDPGPRRPAGGALRHRHQGGPRARGGMGTARACPGCRSTSSNVPTGGSAGLRSSSWPTPRSTATPSAPCSCPGAPSPGGGALPARPDGGQDRRRPGAGAPRQRHHRAFQRGQPIRRPGPSLRPLGPGARRRQGEVATSRSIDAEGRTGLDRQGRRDGPRATGGRAGGRPDAGAAGRGDHADRLGGAAPAGPDGRPGEVGPGATPGRDAEPRVRAE